MDKNSDESDDEDNDSDEEHGDCSLEQDFSLEELLRSLHHLHTQESSVEMGSVKIRQ